VKNNLIFIPYSMKKTKDLLSLFKQLPLKEKKEKLIVMVWMLENSHPTFARLLLVLENNRMVNDEFVDGIYEDIMTFGENIQTIQEHISNKKISEITAKLEHIAQQEKEYMSHEHVENIL
jgi:hypothetical protein